MVYLFYDGPSIRISEVRISEVYQIDFTNGIGDDFMNYRIIAVDFDGTLCYSNWPELGEPNMPLIE